MKQCKWHQYSGLFVSFAVRTAAVFDCLSRRPLQSAVKIGVLVFVITKLMFSLSPTKLLSTVA